MKKTEKQELAPESTGAAFTPVETVKEFIKKKFKNVARFARLAGYAHPDVLHNLFKKGPGEDLEATYLQAQVLDNVTTQDEVATEDKDRLQAYINKEYGGNINRFARTEAVDYPTTHKILKGRINTKTDLVQTVLAVVPKQG